MYTPCTPNWKAGNGCLYSRQLLQGWQAQGYELVSMQQYLEGLDVATLPRHEVVMREVEGRVGTLACQGEKN